MRLHSAEPEEVEAGERVFSVLLQGELAMCEVDVAKEAGDGDRAVVREAKDIEVRNGELVIELKRMSSRPPVLSGIEVSKKGAE